MEPIRLPDINFEAPNLDVPDPPPGTPYPRFEDYRSAELLRVNGIEPDEQGVLDALRTQPGVLQAAAAHTAGSRGLRTATPLLEHLVNSADTAVAVEAAYALARLGVGSGRAALCRLVLEGGPMDLGRFAGSGYLAQLGDRSGYQAVAEGLSSDLLAIRMTACKQLYFFAAPDGTPDPSGMDAETLDLFRKAIADPDTNVQWQALVQLRMLGSPAARPVLEEYARGPRGRMRELAREILDGLP